MRVALVHDWLVTPGGAEDVLHQLKQVFPDAPVFALLDFLEPVERERLALGPVTTSRLQHLPGARRHYRKFLPLMPGAIEALDLAGHDVVVSNSHAVAKGVRLGANQRHLCYCLSPIRYAWDLRDQYLEETGLARGVKGTLARALLDRIQRWDLENTKRVHAFVAISRYIADRITRAYGRDSTVIYPPVDTEFFTPSSAPQTPPAPRTPPSSRSVYVTASRFVPYKRIDLIARAFSRDQARQLVVIGDGPDWAKVERAAGPNVILTGRLPREAVREHLRRSRAFVFAAEEDFGIAPVEAMACGTPVIAYGKGGVAETVRGLDDPRPTGVLFDTQSEEALLAALAKFERSGSRITPRACRENAERFGVARFRTEVAEWVRTAGAQLDPAQE